MINVEKNNRSWFVRAQFFTGTIIFIFLVIGCRQKVTVLKSPPHYDFSLPDVTKLDLRLQEISGIAYDGKRNRYYAIQDESGKLYLLDKETKDIDSIYQFGGKGDYEDVALVDGVPYILRSDGLITRFHKDSLNNTSGIEVGKIDPGGKVDFETMYYDPDRKALVILCKNCSSDEKAKVSAFAFYVDSTGFDPKPIYQIDVEAVNKMAPEKTSHLQPSAAAIHPVLKKLFILSSASSQLVIADLNGNVEGVYVLAKALFPQPEGICFRQSGDMYISNEGGTKKATLFKFLYKP